MAHPRQRTFGTAVQHFKYHLFVLTIGAAGAVKLSVDAVEEFLDLIRGSGLKSISEERLKFESSDSAGCARNLVLVSGAKS